MSELHYRFRLQPHPEDAQDRLLLIYSRADATVNIPIPISEADLIELHGVLDRELKRRRAFTVQDDGAWQLCLPA